MIKYANHSVNKYISRSLFHGSDEDDFVGFEGDLNDLDMDEADQE